MFEVYNFYFCKLFIFGEVKTKDRPKAKDRPREPPFVGSHTPLDLVILQLGLAVEGESAGAARGGDLDSLVDDHDVMPQALLRGEPLAAAVAVVVERGVVNLAVGTHVDHVVLLQLGHLYTSVFISQP